MADLSRD